jgi:hypothetical protein
MKYLLVYLAATNLTLPTNHEFNSLQGCLGALLYTADLLDANNINHGDMRCIQIKEQIK